MLHPEASVTPIVMLLLAVAVAVTCTPYVPVMSNLWDAVAVPAAAIASAVARIPVGLLGPSPPEAAVA
jgi:hypothetical protein